MKELRKSESLASTTLRIRKDMKEAQANYNDDISELAYITKSELKTFVNVIENEKITKEMLIPHESMFDRLGETLLSINHTQIKMDEVVSIIGGLEFSTDQTVDKLSEILNEQELQHSRMSKAVSLMSSLTEGLFEGEFSQKSDLLEDITEFMHDFSRYQDYIIASVPRISQLFDQLDNEEERGLRYNDNI